MFTALLIVGIPVAMCIVSYYWGYKWAVDPLTFTEELFALNLYYANNILVDRGGVVKSRKEWRDDDFEEADTLRPPPSKDSEYKLSLAELAEGWSIKKVDGCWIKVLDLDKVDLMEADLFEEDGETVFNILDPEYLALIASLTEEDNADETPTVRPNPTKD